MNMEERQEQFNNIMDRINDDVVKALAPMKLMDLSRDAMAKMCAVAMAKVCSMPDDKLVDLITEDQACDVDTVNRLFKEAALDKLLGDAVNEEGDKDEDDDDL